MQYKLPSYQHRRALPTPFKNMPRQTARITHSPVSITLRRRAWSGGNGQLQGLLHDHKAGSGLLLYCHSGGACHRSVPGGCCRGSQRLCQCLRRLPGRCLLAGDDAVCDVCSRHVSAR